jgi:endo-1,4-beta-xylanase
MGKNFLFSLLIAGSLFVSCNTSPEETVETSVTWQEAQPLHEIYSDYFMMGNIIRNTGDFTNSSRFGILKRHYNTVTAENDMKPDHLAPSVNPGSVSDNWVYRFGTADSIVNKAIAEGFKVHGHTLIWHSQSPAWLAAGGGEYLDKFVNDVVTHYKGKVISWDVVNEAFRDGVDENDAANWRNCLRMENPNGSPWYQTMGADYIEKAFLAARAADPDAKLYYNDYSLNNAGKSRAVYNMVKEINERNSNVEGRPLIDGIGMQTHHHLYTDPQTVETAIALFASLGVEIAVSEMDIQAAGTFGNNPTVTWDDNAAQRQARQYAAMFKIFKRYSSNIVRITFWGLDDGTSWRSASHPTLMNSDFSLKPAFYAVMNPNKY